MRRSALAGGRFVVTVALLFAAGRDACAQAPGPALPPISADAPASAAGNFAPPGGPAFTPDGVAPVVPEPLMPRAPGVMEALPPTDIAGVPVGAQVIDVRVVGNDAIPLQRINPHVKTRPGRPLDPALVEEDARRLIKSRMFVNVEPRYQPVDGGVVVVFQVVERPTIRFVRYVGSRVRPRTLNKQHTLRVGDPLDPAGVEEARRLLEAWYHEKGYPKASVVTLEGDRAGDRGVEFLIHEGAKQRVKHVEFIGNDIASDGVLRTKIRTKPPILWLFKGEVDRQKIEEDIERLTAYYRSLGFFQARIGRELQFNEKQNWLELTFVIDEGPRFVVRDITVVGNTKFLTQELMAKLELASGEYFDQMSMDADVAGIQDTYGTKGYVRCAVEAEPRFLEEPGTLDLVYRITEGARYRIGRIDVVIKGEHPHTQRTTVLNRLSLRPGDIADIRALRASERRLKASGLFLNDPTQGIEPRLVLRDVDPGDARGGDSRLVEGDPDGRYRGQSPDSDARSSWQPGQPLPPGAPAWEEGEQLLVVCVEPANPQRAAAPAEEIVGYRGQSPEYGQRPLGRTGPDEIASRPVQQVAQAPAYPPQGGYVAPAQGGQQLFGAPPPPAVDDAQGGPFVSGPLDNDGLIQDPYGPGLPPPGNDPNLGAWDDGVPPIESLAPPGGYFVEEEPTLPIDILAEVNEAQTGRIMVGAGFNSDAGVVGNLVIDEQNFNWRRFPRSWEDIRTSTAWRGAGQQLRLEAVPGTQVQRYLISFREPYLFNTPISFSWSAFYFTRLYRDWNEDRYGGRISFGYQFRPDLTGSVFTRLENITLSNPRIPSPPELTEALGDNDLYSIGVKLSHDTRDNTFLATEGHLLEASFEQVFGSFDYPRVILEGRQHFLLRQRPDRGGRHVLTLSSTVGITGNDTPIYDNFFAGGYSSLRGFRFRGASPMKSNVYVGGEFEFINSVEYLFPITADDVIRGVAFCDFGTVEEEISMHASNFRVSPGLGLRITVPAMGPAPIALDFAVPVARADGDRIQNFSFFMGFQR